MMRQIWRMMCCRRRMLLARDAVLGRQDRPTTIDVDQMHRRRLVAEQIADAYSKIPQTREELSGIESNARTLVEEEPW